jgi:TolA-binding protein
VHAPQRLTAAWVTPANLALERAAFAWRAGDLRAVVRLLEAIDFALEPGFEGADRAAFLLAQAYLQRGETDRFLALAVAVGTWPNESHFTRWLAYQHVLVRQGPAGGAARRTSASGDAVAADRLLNSGSPAEALARLESIEGSGAGPALALYVKSLAQSAAGEDDTKTLEALASADTGTVLGRELAGLALIRLATRALSLERDPGPWLTRVPARSPYAAHARHMEAMYAIERGDPARGRPLLEAVAADSAYAGRGEARLALAGLALDAEAWTDAYARYEALDRRWNAERASLEHLYGSRDFTELWNAWQAHADGAQTLALDGDAVRRAASRLAGDATRLGADPKPEPVALDRAGAPARAAVPPPSAAEWRDVAATARALAEARAALDRNRGALGAERGRLDRERNYFGSGREHLDEQIRQLIARGHVLDSLRVTLDALDARIRGVRDAATLRMARRTAGLIETGASHLLWLGAMRHYYLEGAPHETEAFAPPGYPSADSLVAEETALARAILDLARGMAARTPDLIARSYAEAWRPGMIDRTAALSDRARAAIQLARALTDSVDANIASTATSPLLKSLAARSGALEQSVAFARATDLATRDSIARVAIERALAALGIEREPIDYGLAAAAYGRSVGLQLAAGDSSIAAPAPIAGDAPEDPETFAWRARAIAAMGTFLERHPESPARAEMRFRLADALLTDAHETFRARMAEFVRRQSEGGVATALPLLDHQPALDLYRAILEEDPGFEHRDAVLFNAGMILADNGDDAAERYFGELVAHHPNSTYRQESWLRMGDLRFNDRDYAGSIGHYAHAAEGADPNLRAIALYKLGWAHSNEDRFMDAADAFRSALDLYASDERARITADIEGEAETYLVHSLARAGGASAFAGYFDRIGGRDYEMRVLMALADHFRRYSLFSEAADADGMVVTRYPLHADALIAAERLPDTWMRAAQAERARAARLELAERFAPGAAWARAQKADSVRSAGEGFARRSWTAVALHHHAEGRRSGRAADWKKALELYDVLIRTWPADAETPQYNLFAGEASARLDHPVQALAYYRAAADAGADSTAERALRQRVAVTDAWYERTRAGATGSTGRDSLATEVLRAADELLERFPRHEGGADIRWREGHLALAHGWHERAAGDFGRMGDTYPADPRAPAAAGLRADALFRIERFDAAADAFEATRLIAERAGADSIARHAARSVPICHFRHAESVARTDSTDFRRHGTMFEQVAARFPEYEHAHLAQYRAGLAWLRAGDRERAVGSMQTLIAQFPKSEFVKDAHLQIAATWEAAGDHRRAAEAYEVFAGRYPDDTGAANAWLKSADLYAAAGLAPRAESIRLGYIERYPDDHEAAMEILEPLARRDLADVSATLPLSGLLAAKQAAPSALSRYMQRAAAHPKLASRELIAEVRFMQGEEGRQGYEAAKLTQPLVRSIAARQVKLDSLLARYRRTIDLGIPSFAHAGAYRIGEALIGFGTALEQSERPADISGDDRLAYEDVLVEKAQAFYDRGEQVWEELLRQKGDDGDDRWVTEARGALWKRLGQRFYFRPEVEFPLIEAETPKARAAADTVEPAVARREDAAR